MAIQENNSNRGNGRGSCLVIVDLQEAFRTAVPDFALITSRVALAARCFSILEVPIIVTEQYPDGLGRTVEEILLSLPEATPFIEKTSFGAAAVPAFIAKLRAENVQRVFLCGIEAHVCVTQTALGLLAEGFDVELLTDCVASRFEHDRKAAMERLRTEGVKPSSAEMAIFELMGDSLHPKFKEVQSLIK